MHSGSFDLVDGLSGWLVDSLIAQMIVWFMSSMTDWLIDSHHTLQKTQLLIISFASNTCRCISNPSCRRRAAQRMVAAFAAELDFEEVCDQSFSWQLLQWLLNKPFCWWKTRVKKNEFDLDNYTHWRMHSSIYFEFGYQNSIPMRYKLVQWDTTTNRWWLILFWPTPFQPTSPWSPTPKCESYLGIITSKSFISLGLSKNITASSCQKFAAAAGRETAQAVRT